jgi:hypothetical protein
VRDFGRPTNTDVCAHGFKPGGSPAVQQRRLGNTRGVCVHAYARGKEGAVCCGLVSIWLQGSCAGAYQVGLRQGAAAQAQFEIEALSLEALWRRGTSSRVAANLGPLRDENLCCARSGRATEPYSSIIKCGPARPA